MDATFWATVALIIFLAILFYIKVPAKITGSLDDRADGIRKELDDARKLREEAQALLADYQRRQREAEKEAEGIIAAAEREADLLQEEAKAKIEDYIARRTKMAEQKIAQAEAQAAADVKAAAVDLAMAAAETVLTKQITGKDASALVDKSIAEVKANLN
ncbi:F0F1 ATP synthase subunit B [Coralliovum pocilloporae]|uniref:F0F1 ATP synthase subunit B n=1 Tax=Coralliovum pocilloporae TaxID=3066369 RepID=UPI003306C4A3